VLVQCSDSINDILWNLPEVFSLFSVLQLGPLPFGTFQPLRQFALSLLFSDNCPFYRFSSAAIWGFSLSDAGFRIVGSFSKISSLVKRWFKKSFKSCTDFFALTSSVQRHSMPSVFFCRGLRRVRTGSIALTTAVRSETWLIKDLTSVDATLRMSNVIYGYFAHTGILHTWSTLLSFRVSSLNVTFIYWSKLLLINFLGCYSFYYFI